MGGGGLRILPHKKWHVWRRENIERVMKDERENEENVRDLKAKERKIEQERRAQELLLNTRDVDKNQEHLNLFKVEEAQASGRDVGEYKQKKKEKIQDDTLRQYGELPWYAGRIEDKKKKEPTAREERKRKRELKTADPLQYMRPREEQRQRPLFDAQSKHAGSDEILAGSDRRKYCARYDRSVLSTGHRDWRRQNGENDVDKDKKKRSTHCEKKCKSKQKLGKEAMLMELRRERQERESLERRRVERLL